MTTSSEQTATNLKPLAGRTVVITRASSQANDFAAELERYGATVVLCPTIEIRELETYERLDEAIDHLVGKPPIVGEIGHQRVFEEVDDPCLRPMRAKACWR